ncbi:hypothetical protein MSP8886_04369 [Marinomonas spartinae]|uniref:Uncharacterized protein n=1 Tax=Marinomonas spartinae TaxID=1792290 RepID=A0A1A8TVE9_9GAMM|nr:hypothetical protein [Marinomonas spartinae]SBS38044.1 hypothetical protein MSP8886_04369 [Marinomonas spartinae]
MPEDKKKGQRTFVVNQTHIDPSTESGTQLTLAKYELIYAIIGQVLGLVCILGGLALFLNGIAGSTNWTAKIFGAESTITDAAPGAILFIVGLFLVWVTRYKFSHKKAN